LRSGLGQRGGGDVSGSGEGAEMQEVGDEVKDEDGPDNETSPRPHFIGHGSGVEVVGR